VGYVGSGALANTLVLTPQKLASCNGAAEESTQMKKKKKSALEIM
jgi:hypothetical protein